MEPRVEERRCWRSHQARTRYPLAQRPSPHALEGLLQVFRGVAVDADCRVSPGRAATPDHAVFPFEPDADATGDSAPAVGHQHLSMVARKQAKPRAESRWIEGA